MRAARSPKAADEALVARLRLEEFLARIYGDAEARRRFLAAPREEAIAAGLDESDARALEAIDVVGLELAARSYARKRAAVTHPRPSLRGRLARLVGR